MHSPLHHAEWLTIRHEYFRFAAWVIVPAALLANFMPRARYLDKWPRLQYIYEGVLFFVAVLSLNWRAEIVGLDAPMFGFKSVQTVHQLAKIKAAFRRKAKLQTHTDCEAVLFEVLEEVRNRNDTAGSDS